MLLVNIQICNYPFQGAIHSKPSLKGTIIWFHVTTVDTNSNLPSTSLPNATIAAAFGFLLGTHAKDLPKCVASPCVYTQALGILCHVMFVNATITFQTLRSYSAALWLP